MAKPLTGLHPKIGALGFLPAESLHFRLLLLDIDPRLQTKLASMPAEDVVNLLGAGALYYRDRRHPVRAITNLAYRRLSEGVTVDREAAAINAFCGQMLRELNSSIISRYKSLLQGTPGYASTVDLTLLVEREESTIQDFRKRAHVDGSTLKGLESGAPKQLRPEATLAIEAFYKAKLEDLIKPHRG
jgi:hypothetical protein